MASKWRSHLCSYMQLSVDLQNVDGRKVSVCHIELLFTEAYTGIRKQNSAKLLVRKLYQRVT